MEIPYLTPLTDAEQLAFGLDTPQPMAIANRVRYSELDVLNHVNNKAYVDWFETLRTEHYFRLCAPYYQGLAEPRTVLRNANIHYMREMLAGQDYVATSRVSAFRNTSYTVDQQVWSNGLCTRMTGVMVMLHPDGSGRYPLPEPLKQYLRDAEGATEEG